MRFLIRRGDKDLLLECLVVRKDLDLLLENVRLRGDLDLVRSLRSRLDLLRLRDLPL